MRIKNVFLGALIFISTVAFGQPTGITYLRDISIVPLDYTGNYPHAYIFARKLSEDNYQNSIVISARANNGVSTFLQLGDEWTNNIQAFNPIFFKSVATMPQSIQLALMYHGDMFNGSLAMEGDRLYNYHLNNGGLLDDLAGSKRGWAEVITSSAANGTRIPKWIVAADIPNESTDPDKILVHGSDNVVRYMTKAQLGLGSGSNNTWSLGGNAGSSSSFIGTTTLQPLIFKVNNAEAFRVSTGNQVLIGTQTGTTSSEYKLAVGGAVIAEKLNIKLQSSGWPDYVFQKNYRLPTLEEVEQFIRKNNHLPDVSSAKEIEKEGLDVADNQAALLKKIEELTLYIIDLNKQMKQLQQKIDDKESIHNK